MDLVRSSTRRLLETVAAADPRTPSLLPGWSRGHVVAHLARNADAQRRLIAGALRGREVEQYPDGREREIELGAGRGGAELLADLRTASEALDEVWKSLAPAEWELVCATAHARRTLRGGVSARWREVEVHHVDLDAGYGPADWPAEFVREFLPRTVLGMPARVAAVPGGRSWRVRVAGGAAWRITADAVTVDDEPADHEIVGDASALLAWLLGRGPHGVDTGGAPDLPTYFPFA
jgi:maleylpyruvate isomerase